jgi:hypothetical protein
MFAVQRNVVHSTYDAVENIAAYAIVFTLNEYIQNLNNGYGWSLEYWNKLMKCTFAENKSGVLFPLEDPWNGTAGSFLTVYIPRNVYLWQNINETKKRVSLLNATNIVLRRWIKEEVRVSCISEVRGLNLGRSASYRDWISFGFHHFLQVNAGGIVLKTHPKCTLPSPSHIVCIIILSSYSKLSYYW